MSKLEIKAGKDTEELLQFILKETDDATLDEIEIDREYSPSSGLTNEPLTIVAVVTISSTLIVAVTRLIEKYLENKRQKEQIELVLTSFDKSHEAGTALADLAKKNSEVKIETITPTNPIQGAHN